MDRYQNVLQWDIKAREVVEKAKRKKSSEIKTLFLVDELIYVCTHRNKIVRSEAARLIDLPEVFLRTLLFDRARIVRFYAAYQIKRRGFRIRVPKETLQELVDAKLLSKGGRCLASSPKNPALYEDASY